MVASLAVLWDVDGNLMDEILIGGVEKREITIADYDPRWAEKFHEHSGRIAQALGGRALVIEHVGSTAVPGLAAKPIVDIDVLVEDSSDEASYLPAMIDAGYLLRVREPGWHEHRMFRTPALDVHVHVFTTGCVEYSRHVIFRDRLRHDAKDRQQYETVKRRLAKEDWADMNDYAHAKSAVVEQILSRAVQNWEHGE